MSKKIKIRILEAIVIISGIIGSVLLALSIGGLIFTYGIATKDIVNIILGSLLTISITVLWNILLNEYFNQLCNE